MNYTPTIGLLRKRRKNTQSNSHHLSPTQIILLGFISLILVGAVLLSLPISAENKTATPFRDALFTATSATCVTGLVSVDTGMHWSTFGEVVILTLIQIGGLGFMTMAVMMSIFIRRQITPRERMLVAQSLGLSGSGGTVKLAKRILIGTFSIEAVGAGAFATQFIPLFGFWRGIWYSIFHSVSFFCNAGFDILDGTGGYGGGFSSLTSFAGNRVIEITAIFLIVLGGIGFIVWDDIVNFIKKHARISVYSKFILTITAVLLISGTLLVALFEWNNPETLAGKSFFDKFFACLFQSVTTRTAGVDMIDNTAMTEPTKLICMLFMFIGGASGSTAGGIKIGTLGVIVCSMIAFSRGDEELSVYNRTIPHKTVIRALTIVGIDLAAVLTATLIITSTTNGVGIVSALYEAFSGIATVGLSLSLTPTLSLAGHIALIILMFFGRVGVLTITYSLMLKSSGKRNLLKHPDVDIMIG